MPGLFLFLGMQSFLDEVVAEVWKKHGVLEDLIFILPSKRAGSFLKSGFAKTANKTLFSPDIYSIEAFVEVISTLSYAPNTQLLFELYRAYITNNSYKTDDFYDFSKWGRLLLQDFNEIDRYLIPPEKVFSYLSAIQDMNHWYVKAEKTQMMRDYIQFWSNLEQLYKKFTVQLKTLGVGYQGLIYRTACSNLPAYLQSTQGKKHIFIGFNALNAAESLIIQEILSNGEGDIYWDLDHSFLNDPIHDAGFFIRQHKEKWGYFQKNPIKGLSNYYRSEKNIRIVGVPKNVSQVKYVGHLLREIQETKPSGLQNTAVVLGDEALLNPLLNAIPPEIEKVNITMGYPLQKTPLAGLFNQYFDLFTYIDARGWFYRNVLSFLSNNYIRLILANKDLKSISLLEGEIKKKNWVYVNPDRITFLEETYAIPLSKLLFDQNPSPRDFVVRCLEIISLLKERFEKDSDTLGLEYLYHFYTLFGQLKEMLGMFPFIDDLRSLHSLFKELLSLETVDFQGEPMSGLQIMGMLESRNLDFETVIITSVNEGVLPSGKSNNSFIPYDVKREFDLPTYREKDAVYTYHFYRLLQRAKHIYILYNTEPDVLEGGEKSRFINQLLTDSTTIANITHVIAAPEIHPQTMSPQCIAKDQHLMERLRSVAANGLSPTTLTEYIKNPIAFYKRAILNIEEFPEVEETIAANTLGTIIHDVLEELYQPLIGSYITPDKLTAIKTKIEIVVKAHFADKYADITDLSGKNLIALKIVTRYIENFITEEMKEAAEHKVKIIALEEKMKVQLDIPEINFPVFLKGKLDRIDERDGILRIVDYKTGNVKRSQVEIVDWKEITADYEYGKAFQLLCYALMYTGEKTVNSMEVGIISFKNLRAGIFPFATKEKKGSRNGNTKITEETLTLFRQQLHKLIVEICNPQIPFEEKDV